MRVGGEAESGWVYSQARFDSSLHRCCIIQYARVIRGGALHSETGMHVAEINAGQHADAYAAEICQCRVHTRCRRTVTNAQVQLNRECQRTSSAVGSPISLTSSLSGQNKHRTWVYRSTTSSSYVVPTATSSIEFKQKLYLSISERCRAKPEGWDFVSLSKSQHLSTALLQARNVSNDTWKWYASECKQKGKRGAWEIMNAPQQNIRSAGDLLCPLARWWDYRLGVALFSTFATYFGKAFMQIVFSVNRESWTILDTLLKCRMHSLASV